MKNNNWLKIVIVIVILEILTGSALFAYKKLSGNETDFKKNKTVLALYNKINHEDLETLDIMSNEAILYYGYQNTNSTETINCEVILDKKGYECEGLMPFVKESDITKAVRDLYGKNITFKMEDFTADVTHYALYLEESKGFVILEKESDASPINTKMTDAEKSIDKIIITNQVLDGIYGTVLNTYKYTFEASGKNYILIQKEKVKE